MSTFLKIMCYGLVLVATSPVFGQTRQIHQLTCRGMFRDQPAELNGERVYELYNALGDGTVKFTGNLQTPIGKGRLIYEGYTRTAPFDGRLFVDTGPYGGNVYAISILDNTSGQFVIYDGTPTLSAPSEWGNFRCRWVQLR